MQPCLPARVTIQVRIGSNKSHHLRCPSVLCVLSCSCGANGSDQSREKGSAESSPRCIASISIAPNIALKILLVYSWFADEIEHSSDWVAVQPTEALIQFLRHGWDKDPAAKETRESVRL